MVTFTNIIIGIVSAIVVLVVYYFLLKLIDKIRIRRLKKKYDKQEDSSYQGEIQNGSFYTEGRGKIYRQAGDFGEPPRDDKKLMSSRRSNIPDFSDDARDEPEPKDDSRGIKEHDGNSFRRRI